MQRFGLFYIYSLIVADDYILWIASLGSQLQRKTTITMQAREDD